jgi:hypothetical protein
MVVAPLMTLSNVDQLDSSQLKIIFLSLDRFLNPDNTKLTIDGAFLLQNALPGRIIESGQALGAHEGLTCPSNSRGFPLSAPFASSPDSGEVL